MDLSFSWIRGFDLVLSFGVTISIIIPVMSFDWIVKLSSWFWFAEEHGIWEFVWFSFKLKMVWYSLQRLFVYIPLENYFRGKLSGNQLRFTKALVVWIPLSKHWVLSWCWLVVCESRCYDGTCFLLCSLLFALACYSLP